MESKCLLTSGMLTAYFTLVFTNITTVKLSYNLHIYYLAPLSTIFVRDVNTMSVK